MSDLAFVPEELGEQNRALVARLFGRHPFRIEDDSYLIRFASLDQLLDAARAEAQNENAPGEPRAQV